MFVLFPCVTCWVSFLCVLHFRVLHFVTDGMTDTQNKPDWLTTDSLISLTFLELDKGNVPCKSESFLSGQFLNVPHLHDELVVLHSDQFGYLSVMFLVRDQGHVKSSIVTTMVLLMTMTLTDLTSSAWTTHKLLLLWFSGLELKLKYQDPCF